MTPFTIRVGPDLLAAIDEYTVKNGMRNRQEAARHLLASALYGMPAETFAEHILSHLDSKGCELVAVCKNMKS